MPTKKPAPEPKRPVGRPRKWPCGSKPRTLRMTDAEYAAVLRLLDRPMPVPADRPKPPG